MNAEVTPVFPVADGDVMSRRTDLNARWLQYPPKSHKFVLQMAVVPWVCRQGADWVRSSLLAGASPAAMQQTTIDLPDLPFQASVAGQVSVFDLLDWLSGGRVNIVQVYPGKQGG
jgi:hypothetical protein